MVNLGDRVRDEVTGFEGIAVCRATWLHGCIRINVQPEKLDKEGKVRTQETFDEPQLKILRRNAAYNAPGEDGDPRPSLTRGHNL